MLRSLEPIRSSALPFDESSQFNAPPAFGAYRVLHQIGSGVLGPVFRTYEPQHDRLVAVKAFRLDLVPEDVARLAEALKRYVAKGVRHPGIVPMLDAGLEGGTAFLAMEYIAGETLDVAFRHLAPAPLSRALPILATMAAAIDAAWAAGIGHGALHPRDIFFRAGSDDVIVTGFGIVPALEALGAKPPARRPYAAPERVAGEPADLRSDIYSLGAIAHELLTRRRPAGSGELDGALATGVAPEHRDALRRAMSRALAERPGDRFPSATAFVEALTRLGDSTAIPATAAPLFEHLDSERAAGAEEAASATPVEDAEAAEDAEATPPSSREHTGVYMHGDGTLTPVSVIRNWEISLEKAEAEPVVEAAPPSADLTFDKPSPMEAPRAKDWELRGVPVPPPGPPAAPAPPAPLVPVAERPDVSRDRRPLPPAMFASMNPEPSGAGFPWAAVIASTLAGLTLGGVAGYQLGLRQPRPPVIVTQPPPATENKPPAPGPTPQPTGNPTDAAAGAADSATKPPPTTSESAVPPSGAPTATPANGRIAVHSVPAGATVTVDGKSHGAAPQTLRDLPLGTYSVQASKSGYATKTEQVTLTTAKPSADLTITLARGTSTKPAAASTSTTAKTGALRITTRPAGAKVSIDGKAVGTTPLTLPDLSAGTHSVRIEISGYKTVSTKVTIKPGITQPLRITMEQGSSGRGSR